MLLTSVWMKALGVLAVPGRLLAVVSLGCGVNICIGLSKIIQLKRRSAQAHTEALDTPHKRPLSALAKTLGIVAILYACTCGVVALAFKVPLDKLWRVYLLFLAPALAGLPLIFYAQRIRDRPKLSAFSFALGLGVDIALLGIATVYSGSADWLLQGNWTGFATIFTVASATIFGSLLGYSMYKQLMAGKS
ncbi:MAG: hypothetical protein WA755_04800 [Candidatus Acidiferrales bacterium]